MKTYAIPMLLVITATMNAAAAAETELTVGKYTFLRTTLENGLRAAAVEGTGEKAWIFMVVGAGRRHEGPLTTGLAHLTEHTMFSGTRTTGNGERVKRVEAMGGAANAYTRDDYTLYYDITLPPGKLPEVLTMDADRLCNLVFDPDGFRSEQQSLKREEEYTYSIRNALDELVESVVFRNHPYGAWLRDAKAE